MRIESVLYESIKGCMPIACVDVVITWGGRFLLCRRAQEPALGQWWFPGGRVLKNESLRDACVRKCQDELGMLVEPQEVVCVEESIFEAPSVHTINVVFRATPVDEPRNVRLDASHDAHQWFDSVDADWHPCVKGPLRKLGFPSTSGR